MKKGRHTDRREVKAIEEVLNTSRGYVYKDRTMTELLLSIERARKIIEKVKKERLEEKERRLSKCKENPTCPNNLHNSSY